MSVLPITTAIPTQTAIRYNSIQCLRAVAAILVTLYHITENISRTYHQTFLFDWFTLGYAGVDLFFVISGFIIAHTSVAYIDQPQQLKPYLEKRFYRVYPVYWLLTLPLMLVVWSFQHLSTSLITVPYPFNWQEVLKTLVLFPQHYALNAVTWTLSHEIYFYLLFALLLVSRRMGWLLGLIAVATLANGIYIYWYGGDSGTGLLRFFLLSPINLEFAFGVLVYYLHRHFRINQSGLLILVGVLAGLYLAPRTGGDFTRALTLGLPAMLIVWGAVEADRAHLYRVPSLLIHLGDASYMIYLLHFPLIIFANKILTFNGWGSVWILGMADVVLMLLIFWLSWYLHQQIEQPLIRWSKKK